MSTPYFVKKDWDNCGAVGRELLKKSSIVVFVSQDGREHAAPERYQAPLAFAEYPQHHRRVLRARAASNHARCCGAEQRDEKTLDRRSSRGFQN